MVDQSDCGVSVGGVGDGMVRLVVVGDVPANFVVDWCDDHFVDVDHVGCHVGDVACDLFA